MRRMIEAVVSVAMMMVVALGCAGSRGGERAKPRLNRNLDLPAFVLDPPTTEAAPGETFIYGAGQCAVYENEADADLAISTADKLARQKILDVVKNTMASSYRYYAGMAGNANPDVSRAYNNALVTSGVMDLPGVEIVKREYRDGVIYSQARWSKSATNILAVIEGAKEALADEEATRSLAEAKPLWEQLRRELEDAQ